MQIFCKTPCGRTITLEVEPSDSIEEVKRKFEDKEGIPACKLRLCFQGRHLKDARTLAEYEVKRESCVQMGVLVPPHVGVLVPPHITVQTLEGKEITLAVQPSDTVGVVKRKLEDHLQGITADQQRLIFKGRRLEDDARTLAEYKVENRSTLHLVVIRPHAPWCPALGGHITVQTLEGRQITLTVQPSDTVGVVKRKLEDHLQGITADQQRLIFKGRQLEDARTLAEYEVENRSTLHLVVRLIRASHSVPRQAASECPRAKTREYLRDVLKINPCYLDEQHDRCYCDRCADRIPDMLERDKDHPYEVPKGFCGFGLKLAPKAEDLKIFEWPVSFHGCPGSVLPSVLREGSLLLPGDTLIDGSKLPNRLTQGGPQRIQIYTSPSAKYSALDIYTRPRVWQGTQVLTTPPLGV